MLGGVGRRGYLCAPTLGPVVASSRDHVAESPRHLLSGPFQTCLPAVLGPGSAVPASQRGLATRGTALPREGPRGGRRVFLAVPPDLHSPAQARGPTRRFHGEPCSSSEPALGMGSHTEPQKPIVTENVILDTDLHTETRTSTTQGSRSDLRSPSCRPGRSRSPCRAPLLHLGLNTITTERSRNWLFANDALDAAGRRRFAEKANRSSAGKLGLGGCLLL